MKFFNKIEKVFIECKFLYFMVCFVGGVDIFDDVEGYSIKFGLFVVFVVYG